MLKKKISVLTMNGTNNIQKGSCKKTVPTNKPQQTTNVFSLDAAKKKRDRETATQSIIERASQLGW